MKFDIYPAAIVFILMISGLGGSVSAGNSMFTNISALSGSDETTGDFAGGDGSFQNPYQIETYDQLDDIRDGMDKHYILNKDIDASSSDDGGKGFLPIGDDFVPFTGSLDGNGYAIEGLYIDRKDTDYVGLFGVIGPGDVKDLTITGTFTGRNYVGGVAGKILKDGNITNCTSSVAIRGTMLTEPTTSETSYIIEFHDIGGIAGMSNGRIVNCTSTGPINVTVMFVRVFPPTFFLLTQIHSVGGLVGTSSGLISDSNSTGSVETFVAIYYGFFGSFISEFDIGGLVGNLTGGSVSNCSASGWIQTFVTFDIQLIDVHSVGGLIGRCSEGEASECTSSGMIEFHFPITNPRYWYDQFKAVSWAEIYLGSIGGLIGYNEVAITNCSSSREIEYPLTFSTNDVGIKYVCAHSMGTFIGYNSGDMTGCSSNGSLHIDLDLVSQGNDFYPWFSVLSVNITSIGGLIGNNYLGSVEDSTFSGSVRLDLNLAATGIYSTTYSILFGGFMNAYISSIGGLIGSSYLGNVKGCTSYGDLSINAFAYNAILIIWSIGQTALIIFSIGGLIGTNSARIENCVSGTEMDIVVAVTGEGDLKFVTLVKVGGLTGQNGGNIRRCTASGDISTVFQVVSPYKTITGGQIGGISGMNRGTIQKCGWQGDQAMIRIFAVSELYSIGGLVGYNENGRISECDSKGGIWLSGRPIIVGGLVGWNNFSSARVTDSVSSGFIVASGPETLTTISGGIGYNQDSSVEGCSWNGSIRIDEGKDVEKIAGMTAYNDGGKVKNCVSTGSIDITSSDGGSTIIGCLVGHNAGEVMDCSSSGVITFKGTGDVASVGGSVGYNSKALSNTIAEDLVDLDITPKTTGGIHDIGGLVGSNLGEVQKCNSNGLLRTHGRTSEIGGLVGVNYKGGFIAVSFARTLLHYKFDGGSKYSIINSGGLIGHNNGMVEHCFAEGTISINETEGSTSIGGLIGYQAKDGTISNCYSITSMFARQAGTQYKYLGGLVGSNSGKISYSFSVLTRDISNIQYAGSIVGDNQPTGSLTSCFYDNDTSGGLKATGTGSSSGMIPETTVNMMKKDTFQTQGWDFETSWWIIEHRTYPWLYPLYNLPTIDIAGPENAVEEVEFLLEYTLSFSPYPSINRISMTTISTDASWLSYNLAEKKVYGTPANEEVGIYWYNITTRDETGHTVFENRTFRVMNVNDDPEIVKTEERSILADDQLYICLFYPYDEDPVITKFSWVLQTNASWLDFDDTTIPASLSGTPTSYYIGEFWVNVTLLDNEGGFDNLNYTITVTSANDAPVITAVPVPIAIEGEPYVMNLTAEDADTHLGDRLTWSLENGPAWLLFTRTQIRGIPENDDVGFSWVHLKVTDMEGAYDEIGFILEVKNTNDPPRWVEFPDDQNVTEGDLVLLNVLADDVDIGDEVRYNISSVPPSDISIHPVTGVIEWTAAGPGNHTVNVTANDGVARISREFRLSVKERPPVTPIINTPPELEAVEDQEIEAGSTLVLQITASDADGDELLFELEEGPPRMVVSGEGLLVWTPAAEEIGNHTVSLSVTDGKNTSTIGFMVKVTPGALTDDDDATDDDSTPDDDEEQNKENKTAYVAAIVVLTVLLAAMIVLLLVLMRKRSSDSSEGVPEEEIEVRGPVAPGWDEE